MTLPRSVADVLNDHVTLEVEGLDRMYLNVYQPRLQTELGVASFFRFHRGETFASSALMAPMSTAFVAAIEDFVEREQIPMITFTKGQRKDDIAKQYHAQFQGKEGIVFVGKAQEKTPVFRTEKRRNPETGKPYPWIVRGTAMVNHVYFYGLDEDFGPFFLKFCTYFPYTAKLCINGHEYVKRQLAKERIAFDALDNGVLSCANSRRLQQICDGLSAPKIDKLLRKWLARLPHPFTTKDRAAGYRYDISILQSEFSLTQVLDRPRTGRVFLEEVIRENLDIGRPDHVQLIFERRISGRTPGRFRTRVITEGVTPSLHIDYKHTTIKQYHKEGRALRTETTINNPDDFGIRKRLTNLPALREIGVSANRRLLGVQRLSHNPIRAAEAFTAVHDPIITADGARIAGLRLGDRRAHALPQALLVFRPPPNGFLNRDLRCLLAGLLGRGPAEISAAQISYDLRRLRAHGLIARVPRSHRYRVTDTGLHHAMLITHLHTRILQPGLAQLTDPNPPAPTALRTAARDYQRALDQLTEEPGLAA